MLTVVISLALAAVIYLVWEEKAHRKSHGHHRHKPILDEEVKDPSYQPTRPWYRRVFGMRAKDGLVQEETSQGWIRAGATDEWESESAEETKPPPLPSSRPEEYNPSLATKRTSGTYSLPQRSLIHSFVSDRSSVLPSDLPVLPYEDASAPSIRYSVPSIYSQLLPPSPSSASHSVRPPSWSISTVSATPVRISVTPRVPSSPVSIEHARSLDSHDGLDPAESIFQKPPLRTFEGGTKFIEAL